MRGAARIVRLLAGIARRLPPQLVHRHARINGEPGVITYLDGRPWAALVIDTDGERIQAVYRILNPDKLAGLAPAG